MNKDELISLLSEIAKEDTVESADEYDHPCSVAVRALDKCFDDITFLKRVANNVAHIKSKRAQMLLKLNYNPEW